MHTDYSLLDSCTNYQEYIDLAVQNGQRAIAFSEHGKPLGWVSKKIACDKAGIKFMHAVEIYLTESLEEKVRDNFHTILIAKDHDGLLELNSLVSLSCQEDHFYYVNRLTFEEFLMISPHIITTSACLASPLNKLDRSHSMYNSLVKRYDFLEVQPHDNEEQVAFNKRLYELSVMFGKPLIAGTDTHSSSKYKAECRDVLLSAKHKKYDDDSFDLTYKTFDELVEMFRLQNALPETVFMDAINNTNIMADMVEDFELDTSIKYPILYGSAEEDDRKYEELVNRKLEEKLAKGIIPKYQEAAFRKAIPEELSILRSMGMNGFMLSMSELVSWCKENGMATGTARGSVGGSRVAYVSDITDLNPETWGTLFSRFANPNRVEPGDIDTDVVDTDRPAIFKHIIERFGVEKTARVAAFGTVKERGVIDDVGRHLAKQWSDLHPEFQVDKNPWNLKNMERIKSEFDADENATKQRYPELFYYFDGLLGTKTSQSIHPAGIVISPITLRDNYGVFDKDGEQCLMLDMEEAHECGLIKYDMLILKSVKVIRDACNYIGIPYPRSNEIDFNDQAVWESIGENQDMIFQFESGFAAESLKRFKPKSIFDMSLVTACIRPSGTSYRDKLLRRIKHENPSEMIDKLLEGNLGYLVYQEDVSKFLMEICGLDGSTADSVRRGIAKKKMDILKKYLPQIVEGYCSKSDKPRDIAEEEVKEYLNVIEDASAYMFNYSHSVAYCLLGYYYGYFRYYYPLEFITSYLNNAADDDDIKTGTAYARKRGILVTMPKWGVSKGDYFYDKERNIIAKGVTSIKFLNSSVANQLYELSRSKTYNRFIDLLQDISETQINSRQLEVLIKIDYFSDFGNQSELLRIYELFCGIFKKGDVKQIRKDLVDGTQIGNIIKKYATGTTKSGGEAKSYTILDITSVMQECEDLIKSSNIPDLSDYVKIQNFYDCLGYFGYMTGRQEDRRKLYVIEIKPLKRKKDGNQFGYSIITKSIGSGVESRFTVYNRLFNQKQISKNDIIYCKDYTRDGSYFVMTDYEKIC